MKIRTLAAAGWLAILPAILVVALAFRAARLQRTETTSTPALSARPLPTRERVAPVLRKDLQDPGLPFEPNVGQANRQARFLAHGGGYLLFLDGDEVALALRSQEGVRSQKGSGQWSVARGQRERTPDNRLRIGSIGSAFPSAFSIRNSELSSASSPKSQASSFVRLRLVGANPSPETVGLDMLKGKSNYFIGNDPKKWRTNVPNYARVMVKDVYPGIDQVFYGRESGVGSRESGKFEYDFIVHPGADPKQIRLAAEAEDWKLENGKWKLATGNRQLATSANGDIVIATDAGEVRLGKPLVYQEQPTVDSRQSTVATDAFNRQSTIENRQSLQGQYTLTANNELRFELGPYDSKKTLVIDPTINYLSTFGGNNGNTEGFGIALDSSGNAYVTGFTLSTDFTVTPGALSTTGGAIVRKLDPSGNLVYSTRLGGSSGSEEAYAIAVDSSGNAYVTGNTTSADFPTLNAFQPTLAGGQDAFVTELDPAGSALVYSSYLGGANGVWGVNQQDQGGYGIAADAAGNAYVTGDTGASDFPTANAFQPDFRGGQCGTVNNLPVPCTEAFVSKVAAGGAALLYSTYLGGSGGDDGRGIAVDLSGGASVVGFTHSADFPATPGAFQTTPPGPAAAGNAFVAKLSPDGATLEYSTYLGGTQGGNRSTEGDGVAVDSAGNAYVVGDTQTSDFPTVNAFQPSNPGVDNAFISKLTPDGSALVYSSYLGGISGFSIALSVALDSIGEAFITGYTDSSDFLTLDPFQAAYGGGASDAFVAGVQANGAGLIYSTYLGGDGQDQGFGIASDTTGNVWVTGATNSTTFVAAIRRAEVVHREAAPSAEPNRNRLGVVGEGSALPRAAQGRPYLLRPEQSSTSGVTAALAGSIALDMARVHATPASLEFGAQVVGSTSAPQTVTISNLTTVQNHTVQGTAPLTFSAITASDGFAVASGGSCSTSSPVAPGGNCTVNVAFAPTAGGNLTGTLTLTDNGIGSPHSVPLSGTGQDFTLVTDRSSATLKAGVTATILLSVAPQGGFHQALSLTCDDPIPHSTCTVNPTSVTPNPASGATTVVSITTTAPSQVAPRGPNDLRPGPWLFGGQRPPLQGAHRDAPLLLALLALLAVAAMSASPRVAAWWHGRPGHGFIPRVAAFFRRRRPRPLPPRRAGSSGDPWIPACAGMTSTHRVAVFLALALVLLLVLAWAACGGGGQPGTPPGTYSVTLKAADSQANLSHTTTVTLTVN